MPPTVGLGFKPQHFEDAANCPAVGHWYEVHPENYMVPGGPRLAMLTTLRDRYPLSLHGVGLSLAGDAPPSVDHLGRLKALVDRFDPFVVSEHLAWSVSDEAYFPDLLPFPRTRQALTRIADNIDRTQNALGRTILIENPSLYLRLDGHELSETAFLTELTRSTGCGLLVDVNNVYVSARNMGFDAETWLDAIPGDAVGEIHLAGHVADARMGERLLIDTHGAEIAEPVWRLYERLVSRIGPRPTLIERDENIPSFKALMQERTRAAHVLACVTSNQRKAVVDA
ncbi:MAG: DUF692 domain-containing protein [Caulobacterales bacterium]|nr:DUF692 domain-containing protein [Caulobacterales bacterium]